MIPMPPSLFKCVLLTIGSFSMDSINSQYTVFVHVFCISSTTVSQYHFRNHCSRYLSFLWTKNGPAQRSSGKKNGSHCANQILPNGVSCRCRFGVWFICHRRIWGRCQIRCTSGGNSNRWSSTFLI